MTGLQRENRSANLVDAELKGANFRGYAAVFNSSWNDELTQEMGYEEEVAPGAFRKALSSSGNVPLLWQHDRRDLLATTKGQTMSLREDGNGLLVEAKLPDSPFGQHIRELIGRGDVRGMSYGIQSTRNDSTMEARGPGKYVRILRNARKLLDVTLTFEPAYEATTAELRSWTFAAEPLQTWIGGPVEGQTNVLVVTDSVSDLDPDSTPATDDTRERVRALILDQIAWKGWQE